MRYSSTINNIKAKEWGLNIQQAYLFSWIYELPSWADKVVIGNDIYYFAAKNKAVTELPILTTKTDTMYRYYKQLEKLNLIALKKIDGKDYIALTVKGKSWNFSKSDTSEINPNSIGNKSESNSEINPTYNNIIPNKEINNKSVAPTAATTPAAEPAKDLFNEPVINPNKKTLFKNSAYFDLAIFTKKLPGLAEINVDIAAYHRAINNWSEQKNQKRTANGWVATARSWAEADKDKGKLKLIKTDAEIAGQDKEAMDYLQL